MSDQRVCRYLLPVIPPVRRAERAPQEKRPCRQRASGTARPPRGRSAHGRRDGADAAQAAARGDGRYSDRARRPASADGRDTLRRTGKRGRRGGHAGTRCAPVPTVAENGPEAERTRRKGMPREATAPERNLMIVERGGRKAWRPFRPEVPLGRSPPHADRHSTHRTLRTRHNVRQARAQGVAPFSPGSTVGPFSVTR